MASGTIKSVVPRSDIVNNLTTNDATKVLSAKQGKELNDNLKKIEYAYSLGSQTLANIESALATLGGTMAKDEVRYIKFRVNPASGVFAGTTYAGTIYRNNSGIYTVNVQGVQYATQFVQGVYTNSTWDWNSLNDNITNLVTGYTSYTPEITSSENTGFAVNSISFVYARTGKLMFINGRFNITNAGSNAANSSIYISLPSGYTCGDTVGACGYITLDRAGVDISNISIRQMSNKMWVQKGAGSGKTLGVIGTGFVMVSATIILN